MGMSNLKVGLARKLAAWNGERILLEKQIATIEAEYVTLDQKRSRIERLAALAVATAEILVELDPKWSPDQVKPVVPKSQQLPFEHGTTSRTAFDIMRELGRPTNPSELAPLVVTRLGGDPADEDLIDRVKVAIDAQLRKQKHDSVRMIRVRPTRWEIIND
jgi:hypothetical protein